MAPDKCEVTPSEGLLYNDVRRWLDDARKRVEVLSDIPVPSDKELRVLWKKHLEGMKVKMTTRDVNDWNDIINRGFIGHVAVVLVKGWFISQDNPVLKQNYLSPLDNPAAAYRVLNSEFSAATKNFQAKLGIPQTGIFDLKTVQAALKDYCD